MKGFEFRPQCGRRWGRKEEVRKEGGIGPKRSKPTWLSSGDGFLETLWLMGRRQNMQNWNIQCTSFPGTHKSCCPGGHQLAGEWNLFRRPNSSFCSPHQHRHQLVVSTKVFGLVHLLRVPDVVNRPEKSRLRKSCV